MDAMFKMLLSLCNHESMSVLPYEQVSGNKLGESKFKGKISSRFFLKLSFFKPCLEIGDEWKVNSQCNRSVGFVPFVSVM